MTKEETIKDLAGRLAKLPKEKRNLKAALGFFESDVQRDHDEQFLGQKVAIASFALEEAGKFDARIAHMDMTGESSMHANPFPMSPEDYVQSHEPTEARVITGKTSKEPTMATWTDDQKFRFKCLETEAARLRAYAQKLREESEQIRKDHPSSELWKRKLVDAERHDSLAEATLKSFLGEADRAGFSGVQESGQLIGMGRFERAVMYVRKMPAESRTVANVTNLLGGAIDQGIFTESTGPKLGHLSVSEEEAARVITEATTRDIAARQAPYDENDCYHVRASARGDVGFNG